MGSLSAWSCGGAATAAQRYLQSISQALASQLGGAPGPNGGGHGSLASPPLPPHLHVGHLVGGVVGAGSSLPLPHGGVVATLDADVATWGAAGLNLGFQEALGALLARPGGGSWWPRRRATPPGSTR